ncbi:MAG: sugar transferase [Planctomycetes bacterium]|nr:sugar transferase [Planctomycetota bacterium]
MSVGTFVRRNFEPVVLSVQVLLDLVVVLASCWVGYLLGERLGSVGASVPPEFYQKLAALIAAVCLVSFHAFGLYKPTKSLLNMEEFQAIFKATAVAFLVLFTLVVYLHSTQKTAAGPVFEVLVPLHRIIDLDINPNDISRLTLLLTFGLVLALMTASRFVSFKTIQLLHRRGIGNRNVLVYGTGDTARKLQRKFMIVPTLGLNLVGFVEDEAEKRDPAIEGSRILGRFEDLERLVGVHKISEVFIAMPEAPEERVMRVVSECERLGVVYKIVPRFYHLLAFKVRIETLDSIPLITRPDRRPSLMQAATRRVLDLVVASLVIVLFVPVLVVTAILIKRESPGPVFFVQHRIGRDGRPFPMIKFRTMHHHMSGDALAPRSSYDPRITRIGRWLRRYSLDELPQFFNVIAGHMSVVGPRPEMRFIVDAYSPLERERLRVKPGITGLWQISYARAAAIHENLDYDLYYIEHQSLLLDVVIIALTGFAVVKGSGAY